MGAVATQAFDSTTLPSRGFHDTLLKKHAALPTRERALTEVLATSMQTLHRCIQMFSNQEVLLLRFENPKKAQAKIRAEGNDPANKQTIKGMQDAFLL